MLEPHRFVKIQAMDFNQFLHSRKPRWERLSRLLDKIDRHGVAGLGQDEVDEFFSLYRLASSDLNLVQTRTGNAAILESLEHLVARAYANLVVPRHGNFFVSWWKIVRHYFPAAIRGEAKMLGWATSTMICGFLFGFFVTQTAPGYADVLVGPFPHLLESPAKRVAQLEAQERDGHNTATHTGHHASFSTQLAYNNIRVSVLAFALGLTFGVLTAVVLFFNSAILGCATALYLAGGEIVFLAAWLGPHGSIEIPCIAFAGTAGLMMARAQFQRDQGPVMAQIRAIRPKLIDILIGTATLLVIAGLIEGGFSQIHEPTLAYPFKIAVAAALFAALLAYLSLMPAKPRPAHNTIESGMEI